MRVTLLAFVFAVVGAGCATLGGGAGAPLARGEDDFYIENGALHRDKEALPSLRIAAMPGLLEAGLGKEVWLPALNRIAEAGGNSVCFDPAGLSADGRSLDAAALAGMSALIERAALQKMGAVLRIPGEVPAACRETATRTLARAFAEERRALYLFDGEDAADLVRQFRRLAPDALIISPEGGDLRLIRGVKSCTDLPRIPVGKQSVIDPLIIAEGVYPEWPACDPGILIPGTPESLERLDRALMRPEERNPWRHVKALLDVREQSEGFVPLFGEHDLKGWWHFGDNTAGFHVSDCGYIEWAERGGGALMSDRRYGDFVLRLEYKILKGGNSGIYLRAPRNCRQSYIGMEFQVQGDAGEPPKDDGTGALYKQLAPLKNASKPSPEWNALEITLQGTHLRAVLNGEVVQDTDLSRHEDLKYRLHRGFIGLQDHGNYVAFRKIRIKEL